MNTFTVQKTPFEKAEAKMPWYMGNPLIVVLSPLFVLAALMFVVQGWLKELFRKAPEAASPKPNIHWQDWIRNEGFRVKVRPVRPTEALKIVDEWYAQVDIDEEQDILYVETEPPVSPLHGAFISSFRHEGEGGMYLQRLWFVEDQEIALDSELVFIPYEGALIQHVSQAGPFCLEVKDTTKSLVLEGLNHDEGVRLEITR